MAITPKKTKYHYAFRNKLQTNKIIKAGHRAQYPLGSSAAEALWNQLFKTNAWLPAYKASNSVKKSNKSDHIIDLPKANFLSHAYTNQLLFGNYGIIFKTHGKITAKFIKTVDLDIARMLKKKSKVWLRICCDTPVTTRPVETRMGKGKGAISYWEAKVSPGQIMFEFCGTTKGGANAILKSLQRKSPIQLQLVEYAADLCP